MADSRSDFPINQGFHATVIHGNQTQKERERALEYFRNGRCPILVATAVAACVTEGVVRDLIDLPKGIHQEVPSFLEILTVKW
jgi:superfamily II DNA/RNA helicase